MKKFYNNFRHWLLLPDGKTNIKKTAFLCFLFLFLIYILLTINAPVRKVGQLNQLYFGDSVNYVKDSVILNHPELYELYKNKAFKDAQLKLAKKDSISLIINLLDSSFVISIKGVNLHTAKIKNYKEDKILKAIENQTYINLFSQPLIVEKEFTSIVKEPVIVKKAPKDTLEALKALTVPDTLQKLPAFVSYRFAQGIKLIIQQDEKGTFKEKRKRFCFMHKEFIRTFGKSISYLFHFKLPDYCPVIKISIPGDDLRTIYRALPEKPKVVLYF